MRRGLIEIDKSARICNFMFIALVIRTSEYMSPNDALSKREEKFRFIAIKKITTNLHRQHLPDK